MKKTYQLSGIDCGNCAGKLENVCNKKIKDAKVTILFLTQKLIIEADDDIFAEKEKEIFNLIHKKEKHITIK